VTKGRRRRAIVRLGACVVSIGFAYHLGWVPRVAAADPSNVVVSGSPMPRPVVISDLNETAYVRVDLCGDQLAGPLAERAFLAIRVSWTDELHWDGRFYPAVAALPAAVDIPNWKLYGSGSAISTCRDRVAGPKALAMLSRHGVPVELTAVPATDSSLAADRPLVSLGWLLLTLGVILSAVHGVRRARKRAGGLLRQCLGRADAIQFVTSVLTVAGSGCGTAVQPRDVGDQRRVRVDGRGPVAFVSLLPTRNLLPRPRGDSVSGQATPED